MPRVYLILIASLLLLSACSGSDTQPTDQQTSATNNSDTDPGNGNPVDSNDPVVSTTNDDDPDESQSMDTSGENIENTNSPDVVPDNDGDSPEPVTGSTDNNAIDLNSGNNPQDTIFRMASTPVLPPRCVGTIDQEGTQFCVDPETRVLSATTNNGALWWSFVLPGENNSNQIESVLTTNDWLVLVADRYPVSTHLSADQRANQYEASVFEKSGAFVRTVNLSFNLNWSGSSGEHQVSRLREDGRYGMSLSAVAVQSEQGTLLLAAGWNRWRYTPDRQQPWDFSGITLFDLLDGGVRSAMTFPEQGINDISLAQSDRPVLRILTTEGIDWRSATNLSSIDSNSFAGVPNNALVGKAQENQSQLHGGNYRQVIDRLLPWINADVPKNAMYVTAPQDLYERPPRILFDDFTLLQEFEDEIDSPDATSFNDQNSYYQCINDGYILRRQLFSTSIFHYEMDSCQAVQRVYSGFMRGDYVGRDGYATSARKLLIQAEDGSSSEGTYDYSVGFFRTGSGSSRTYSGSFVLHNDETNTAEAVAGYRANAEFFHGRDFGASTTCAANFDVNGNPFEWLNCTPMKADGSISANFSVNGDWSSYTNLVVSADLKFGGSYYQDLSWIGPNGVELANPVPTDRPTTPLTQFYFSGGSIEIQATDSSRIILTPLGAEEHPLMRVQVFDKAGNESGNFAAEPIDIKCSERLGECLATAQ